MVLIGRLTAELLAGLERKLANDNEKPSTVAEGVAPRREVLREEEKRNCDCGAVEVIRTPQTRR